MEKVSPEEFDSKDIKNRIIAFLKTLDLWEVAKINRNEWTMKSKLYVGIYSDMTRVWRKMSVKEFPGYYLVKRIK
jgi:hypothetical protein